MCMCVCVCVCVCVCAHVRSVMSNSLWPQGPPDSSVHRISQARILEWVATSFSRGSSEFKDRTLVSCGSRIGRWIFIGLYGSKWPWEFLIPLSILHTSFRELTGWTELGSSFPGEGFIPVCHQGCLSPHSSQACSSSLHLMKTVVVDQRAPSLRSQEWLLENCSFKLLMNLTDESNLIFDTLKPGLKRYHHVDTIL